MDGDRHGQRGSAVRCRRRLKNVDGEHPALGGPLHVALEGAEKIDGEHHALGGSQHEELEGA